MESNFYNLPVWEAFQGSTVENKIDAADTVNQIELLRDDFNFRIVPVFRRVIAAAIANETENLRIFARGHGEGERAQAHIILGRLDVLAALEKDGFGMLEQLRKIAEEETE